MENMTEFFVEMLHAVATFLGTEPIIYLFGLVCLVLVVKVVKDIPLLSNFFLTFAAKKSAPTARSFSFA